MVRLSEDEWDAVQTAPPTSYSLGGSGLDQIATMQPDRISDGLGHWWDSATQSWQNDSGGAYQANDYSADPGLGIYGDQSYSAPTSYSLNSPQLDQIATTYAGPTWVDNGTPGGKYVDQWGNESYDGGNTWVSPGQMQPPAFAPDSWSQPQPQPDSYSLGFGGTAFDSYGNQGVQNPWDTRLNPQQDSGGGFWGGVKDVAGDVGKGALTTLGAAREYVGEPIFGTLSGLSDSERQPIYDPQGNIIGYTRDPGLGDWFGDFGSAVKRTVTDPVEQYKRAKQGSDEYFNNPENSPYWNAVGQVAIDPLSYVGPGLASKVIPDSIPAAGAIRGLLDQGGGGAVLGGAVGGTFGASDTAEKIPGFGDQPDWLRGLEGGVIGGLAGAGAAGSLKATAAAGSPRLSFTGEVGEAATPDPLNPIRRKIADALDEELKFRNSGEAEAIKSVKRAEQASGLNAVEAGATSAETLANVSAGAKVGKFFDNTPGLKLSEPDYNAALTDLVNSTEGFDKIQAVKALDKLQKGERLQPNEIKALGKLYGPEIEAKIRATNGERVSSIADLTPQDKAQIARQAEVDGRKVATLEVQAKRQHELADQLNQRSLMNPTNKQLKTAAEDARARAIKAENDADRILAERVNTYVGNQQKEAFSTAQREAASANRGSFEDALRRDKRLAAEEARVRKAAEDEWIRGLEGSGPDEYAMRQARYETNTQRSLSAAQDAAKKAAGQKASDEWARSLGYDVPDQYAKTAAKDELRAQRDLGKLQDKVHLKQMQATNKEFYRASPEQAVTKAKDVVAKLDVSDNLKSQLIDTIELGAKRHGIVLDGMGESAPGIMRKIYAGATGEVTDSYTSKLLTQRAFIQNALESQGLSSATAKQISKLLQDAELRLKYGDNIPEWVTKSLDEAKFDFAEGGAIKGLADISQELKNTQFGIGDMAVFGQQAAKAGLTNAPQIVTGYVNRVLNAMHLGGVNTAIPEAAIARDTQYALDGLALHSHGITDIVNNERTLLSRLGAPGRLIDEKVALPAIKKLTDFQFDTVLGNLRKTIYEGNLVMAKLSGADITDPIVRQRAAEMANAATGAGKLAQRSARANAEKAFLLSPSMRRAQIQQWGQVIKGLSHQDTALSSAMAITSSVGLTLAVGKLLSDYTGIPFETDPSKPKFGNIRLPDGTTINPFSQEQIAKAFARSIRILAEDQSPDAAKRVTEEWGKIIVSSASPAIRPWLAQAGVGIDQNGYHWGDLMEGKSPKQLVGQALMNTFAPPILQSATQRAKEVGWKDAILSPQTALDALGVNSYPESKYDVRDRKAMEQYKGKTYAQLSEAEKFAFDQKNGKVMSSDPKIRAQQEQSAALIQQQTDRQNARDAQLQQNGMTPDNWRLWRDQRKQDNLYFAGRFDQLYQGVNFTDKNVTDVDRYYKAIADNTDRITGDVNWDAVDQATKGLDQAYIKANTNLRDTSVEKVYHDAVAQIEGTGYFDREKQAWQQVAALVPTWDKLGNPVNPSDYGSYDEWRTAALKAGLELAGKTPSDVGTVTQINSWLDKQDPAKGVEYYTKQWKDEWVATNPREAYLAWQMGYYNPRKEIKDWLTRQFE